MAGAKLDNRPREERDFKDFYSDLDEASSIPIYVNLAPYCSGPVPSRNTEAIGTRNKGVTKCEHTQDPLKISKSLALYGYRGKVTKKHSIDCTYIRGGAVNTPVDSATYDMDEQDEAWLELLNEELDTARISPEAFEIAITVLEQKWKQLETKMERVAPNSFQDTNSVLTLDTDYSLYGSDDGMAGAGSLIEQRCAVCNDLECENTNAIVFCDSCNIAVHQECYGIAFIPEGHWYCRRCMVSRGTPVSCTFCPSKTGAFKQLDNGLWSHVVCALWINEVYFANPIYMEPIEGVISIPKNRWKLVCYICKQKMGASIQCTNRNCFSAYHVTCAKRAGSYMAMEKGVQGALASKATLKSFCDRHGPPDWNREHVLHGIAQTRRFYRDCQLLNQRNDRLAFKRQQQNRQNSFKWKTEAGTPIAPHVFVDDLERILIRLKCSVGTQQRTLRGPLKKSRSLTTSKDVKWACAALCRYWSLKREAKRGAALVRLRASNHAEEELENKTETRPAEQRQKLQRALFGNRLQHDLSRLITLCALAKRREQLCLKRNKLAFSNTDLAYFPVSTVAKKLLADLEVVKNLQKASPKSDKYRKKEEMLRSNTHVTSAGSNKAAFLASEKSHDLHVDASACLCDFIDVVAQHKLFTSQSIDLGFRDTIDAIVKSCPDLTSVKQFSIKTLKSWDEKALPLLRKVEAGASSIPFVNIDGLNFNFKKHNASEILASEDLSEIEEDPFRDPKTERIFRTFLNSRS